jgi:flagellar hook-associated protein 2
VDDRFSVSAYNSQIAQAADAIISVDGIEIQRDTNTFTGVIDGVTLTAKAVTDSAQTVTVAREDGLLNAEVMKFQSAYNSLVSTISSLTAYDAESGTSQPLFADSTTRSLKSSLANLITSPVSGVDSEYNTLASIGLKIQADGTLGFNQTTMNAVMDDDPDAIMRLFAKAGQSTNSAIQFVGSTDKTTAKTFQIDVTAPATKASVSGAQALQIGGLAQDEILAFTVDDNTFTVNLSAGDAIGTIVSKINARFSTEGVDLVAKSESGVLKIESQEYGSQAAFTVVSDRDGSTSTQTGIGTTLIETTGTDVVGAINGLAATGTGQTLKGPTGSEAEGLELLIDATSPTSGSITVTSGIADTMLSLLESYIDSDTGKITARQEGIADSISDLNDSIDRIESRIERDAERMRNQFLAMEKILSQYQGIADMVTNSISQLQSATSK